MTTTSTTDTTTPPPTLEWDERGLLKGVAYSYRLDGTIDWKRMIPAEYLGIQDSHKEALKAKFKTESLSDIDKTKVPDWQLLVLLAGWKRLLFLRGYTSLTQTSDYVSPDKAVSTCTITFAPNYETRMQAVTYSWTASASYSNTSGDIPQMFLEATACNRAFCLCLRGFLNIGLVGSDEMGPKVFVRPGSAGAPGSVATPAPNPEMAPPQQTGFQGKDTLAKRCGEVGLTFEAVKTAAGSKYKGELKSDPATWTSFDDVPSLDAYLLLDKIAKAAAERGAAGKGKKG